ncbi:MAG: hypothetical protein ACD_46C00089G0002 [uncultured bacterium]|nr:MAG: hypothetical protein ACD_46C00089G0002 [uncultured bacterium]
MRAFVLLFILFSTNFSTVFAATFYRHIPFSISAKSTDTIIADYTMNDDQGVHCESDIKNLFMTFTYKGKEKTAELPVVIQNSHVPESAIESLADLKGQFTLSNHATVTNENKMIRCKYTESLN